MTRVELSAKELLQRIEDAYRRLNDAGGDGARAAFAVLIRPLDAPDENRCNWTAQINDGQPGNPEAFEAAVHIVQTDFNLQAGWPGAHARLME